MPEVIPPDTRTVGSGNPPLDMDNVADVLGRLVQMLAQLGGGTPGAPPGANAANLAIIDGLVGAAWKLTQQGNSTPLVIQGNNTALADQFQVQDYLGDIIFGAGIIGPYTKGAPFFLYDRFSAPACAITPLVGGLTGTGTGIQGYAPAQSPNAGAIVSGTIYLNWMGLQDSWSGADMELYLPVTFSPTGGAAATLQAVVGACPILTSALVSGTNYTSLSVQPIPGVIPNGTSITLRNGANSQTVTTSAQANYDAQTIPVTSFNANANYSAFSSLGAAPTTWMTVASANYPWQVTLLNDSEPAGSTTGRVRTVRFKVPHKWFYQVTGVNATLGTLQGLTT